MTTKTFNSIQLLEFFWASCSRHFVLKCLLDARKTASFCSEKVWKHGTWIMTVCFGGDLESWRLNLRSNSQGSASLGILLEERGSWWMKSQISTPWDFGWSSDGPSSVFLISHRQALRSPRYSIFRFSSVTDSCGGCEEERRKAPHPPGSCWGNRGQVRQRRGIWWLMPSLGAESGCFAAAVTFPCACPGSLSVMMQRGRT